ncbi:MAG: serine hydrolase [Pseudomonadota bacterium]
MIQTRYAAVSILLVILIPSTSYAWNGAVGYATHMPPPELDGDLSDWPDDTDWQPVANNYFHPADSDNDLSAAVRFAFNTQDEALYVALQVKDDIHTKFSDGNWRTGDSAIVYLDRRHRQTASGVAGYVASEQQLFLSVPETPFDSAVLTATLDDVSVGVSRSGTTTTYEFRLDIGSRARPNTVLGADIAIFDTDPEDENFTANYWGPYWAKTGAAGRAGDVILVDPDVPLGTVRGTVEWRDQMKPLDGQAPLVRLTSVDNPNCWIQVAGIEFDRFDIELPPGEYVITYPLPILGDLLGPHDRVDPNAATTVRVTSGEIVVAEPLILTRMAKPDLYEREGVLFSWDESKESEFDRFVAAWMGYFTVPGLAIAIVKDTEIAYHQVYGVSNYATQSPVTKETIFEAASITKIVFAFAVMRLAEQDIIDLDRPLHEYLAFDELEHDERYRLMTARHVLTHQTGLPNWRSGDLELAFTPGEGYGYSGEGIEYLKRVVVEITGKPIEEILLEEVQIPMGFEQRTYFSDNEALRATVATGHSIERPNTVRIPRNPGMAHSMHTEADALGNFMVSLLQRRGLKPETYDEMFTWATNSPPEPSEHDMPWEMGFGLGFGLVDAPHGRGIWHGGNNGDFHARFEAYPELGIGLIVMANNERGWAMGEVIRRYLLAGSDVPSSLEAPLPRP